jgi:hypothetical protein
MFAAVASCGSGDDDGPATEPASLTVTPTRGVLSPPLEGPAPTYFGLERLDYRELPEWRLPEPDELPTPPDDAVGDEFDPPETPECPEGWIVYERPVEGFRLCYPEDWALDGEGYVTVAHQDRWYSAGIFRFEDGVQAAHVSIYAMNSSGIPSTYTKYCEQAYQVTLGGLPAVLCPDAPGVSPEARIIAYHVRSGDLDYFVNVVPYFAYDPATGTYDDFVDPETEDLAIQIAQTFEVTEPFDQ